MSARTITPKQFAQLKKLMRIAQMELQSHYRTRSLICELLPPVLGIGHAVDDAVDRGHSARELCRQLDLSIKKRARARK